MTLINQLGFSALCLLATSLSWASVEDSAPMLEIASNAQNHRSPAILLNMDIAGEINGMLANIRMQQTFRNPSQEWVNGVYVFPLPEDAAIDGLTLWVDGRRIRANIEEKTQAQKTFDNAQAAGQQAALLKQSRPNLFTMQIANIPPQGEVRAELSTVHTAHYHNGAFSLRLPTTLTPRYIPAPASPEADDHSDAERALRTASPPSTITVNQSTGWANDHARVPDASAITPPQFRAASDLASHRFSIDILLDSGLALAEVRGSQALNVAQEGQAHRLHLREGSAKMDADFLIHWRPEDKNAPQAAVFFERDDEASYQMVMLLPPLQPLLETPPRRLLFVLDSSGSMAGEPMRQAQASLLQALSTLRASDRFNIIDFDHSARALFARPMPADDAHLAQARDYVHNVHADGGTEMLAALQLATAAAQRADEGYVAQIVFITDGSVGNEGEIFREISQRLDPQERLFTVGIGQAPNTHFMSKAAQFGRGTYTYIADAQHTQRTMDALLRTLREPVLTDIRLDWGSGEWVVYPDPMPDLYRGEPLLLVGRGEQAPSQLSIRGQYAGQPWLQHIDLSRSAGAKHLNKLWARRYIAEINDSLQLGLINAGKARNLITPLALKYQLLSPYTSFVAVDERISRSDTQAARTHNVPNLMPKGTTMQAPYPATATNARALQWAGIALLLLALLLHHARRLRWV